MIFELMVQLKEEFDLIYLFITHDLTTSKYICDRVAIMYLGKIVEIGPLEEVFENLIHPYTTILHPNTKWSKQLSTYIISVWNLEDILYIEFKIWSIRIENLIFMVYTRYHIISMERIFNQI